MTQNRRSRVYFNGLAGTGATAPADGYAAVIDSSALGNCGTFTPIADPAGGGNQVVTLNTGNYTGITLAPSFNCLEYDSLGRPYNCGAGPAACSGPALLSAMTITAKSNTVAVGSVAVTGQTGAVN